MALTKQQMQAIYDQMGMNRQVRSFEVDMYANMSADELMSTLNDKYQGLNYSGGSSSGGGGSSSGGGGSSSGGGGGGGGGYGNNLEQQVIDAYVNIFGRQPRQEALDFYTGVLRNNPNFNLTSELRDSPEAQFRAEYQDAYGQQPTLDDVDSFLASGQTVGDFVSTLGAPTGGGSGGGGGGGGGATSNDPREQQFIDAYMEILGRPPEQSAIDNFLSGNQSIEDLRTTLINSQENRTIENLGEIGAPNGVPFNTDADRPSIADLAYTLTTGTNLDIPDYRVADYSPDMLEAFRTIRENQGVYQPYLNQGVDSTMQGIGALGDALSGTRDLAGQIGGQVQTGQAALSRAATDLMNFARSGAASAEEAAAAVQRAAQSSDPATRRAAQELLASSERLGGIASLADSRLTQAGEGAQGIASQTANRARNLFDPMRSDLAQATAGARGAASTGQAGADLAAQRARMSTAAAQDALQNAAGFGLGTAQQGIATLQGTGDMYSPDMIAPYMNTYEDAAVQQALQDIQRQGLLEEERLAAQAIQAGAYGGSRQAVAERELNRNVLEQQGRTAAQMRNQGFESAAQRSQSAFEDAMRRRQQSSQLTGQLGQMGAGAAAGAAEAGGRLGLAAEQLAQGSALQGAQLGLSAEQFASANAQAVAQTGLSIEQLASQTGLSAQELAGRFAGQSAQIGLGSEQGRQSAVSNQAQLMQSQAQLGMQGAESAGRLRMDGAQLGMQGAMQAGNLGLQGSQLGLSGIQAGLGAQQQAAGIGQGIAGLGQQMTNMGGQAQQMGMMDVNALMQSGQLQMGQRQAELDAERLNQYQKAMLPYQQLAYASDIMNAIPTGITSTMSQPMQSPSLFSQIGGLGIAALGAFGGL